MQPFTTLTGVAVPYVRDNVTTDEIAPQQMMRRLDPDYREMLFLRQRRRADGSENPDFILHQPQFRDPAILVAGANFGCGSARETAQWALIANGIRCVVAKSFADIFRENCLQNGMLTIELPPDAFEGFFARVVAAHGAAPFTADLPAQRIGGPGGSDISFDIAPADRMRLLEGLDDIGMTLKHLSDIAAWEQRAAGERPWLQTASIAGGEPGRGSAGRKVSPACDDNCHNVQRCAVDPPNPVSRLLWLAILLVKIASLLVK